LLNVDWLNVAADLTTQKLWRGAPPHVHLLW